jgi:hypothetical protein
VACLLLPVQRQPGGHDPRLGIDSKHVWLTGLGLDGVEDFPVLAGVLVAGPDGEDCRADGDRLADLRGVGRLLKDRLVVIDVLNVDLGKEKK